MRKTQPTTWFKNRELDLALRSICLFSFGESSEGGHEAYNPEDVLLSAVREGLSDSDYRLLGVVSYFIESFFSLLNVSRLTNCVAEMETQERNFWIAHFQLHRRDPRTAKVIARYKHSKKTRIGSNEWAFKKYGLDPRFKDTKLEIHSKLFEGKDIELPSVTELASKNPYFRNRLVIGPTNRADAWTVLELEARSISTNRELSDLAYCSLETARNTRNDFRVIQRTPSRRPYPKTIGMGGER
ncbi:hypothetical protein GW915_00395 [bacterium]|nr:hypothetical protein [bacterium]